MKVNVSGRLDGLIGNNILAEIKSMPYEDYIKAVKTQQPRHEDFIQALLYTYMLENHLDEIKKPHVKVRQGTAKPKLDRYKITTLQFIYVAHDLMTADVEDFGMIMKKVDELKKRLNSKQNKFFFMTSICLDFAKFDPTDHFTFINNKLKRINHYMDSNTLPPETDEFVNKKCFFCIYKELCDIA